MIGKNLKDIRKQNGISQEELAQKLNVTRQAVSNWENNKTEPDLNTLQQLAEQLHVTVEDLIYGKKSHHTVAEFASDQGIDTAAAIGVALAVVLSYTHWHSIGWAIFHGLLNWVYVIYYAIRY